MPTRWIEQIVLNLLNNAGKYTQDGGRIEISLKRAGLWAAERRRQRRRHRRRPRPRLFQIFQQGNGDLARREAARHRPPRRAPLVELHRGMVERAAKARAGAASSSSGCRSHKTAQRSRARRRCPRRGPTRPASRRSRKCTRPTSAAPAAGCAGVRWRVRIGSLAPPSGAASVPAPPGRIVVATGLCVEATTGLHRQRRSRRHPYRGGADIRTRADARGRGAGATGRSSVDVADRRRTAGRRRRLSRVLRVLVVDDNRDAGETLMMLDRDLRSRVARLPTAARRSRLRRVATRDRVPRHRPVGTTATRSPPRSAAATPARARSSSR
jgi:hypothetical protein